MRPVKRLLQQSRPEMMVAGARMSAVKEVRSRWVLNIGIQGRANRFF